MVERDEHPKIGLGEQVEVGARADPAAPMLHAPPVAGEVFEEAVPMPASCDGLKERVRDVQVGQPTGGGDRAGQVQQPGVVLALPVRGAAMTTVLGEGEPVIRTPDQRLRVFVSSTLGELAEERAAVRAAIERLRLVPVMFELGARPHPPRELYRAYLVQSHLQGCGVVAGFDQLGETA